MKHIKKASVVDDLTYPKTPVRQNHVLTASSLLPRRPIRLPLTHRRLPLKMMLPLHRLLHLRIPIPLHIKHMAPKVIQLSLVETRRQIDPTTDLEVLQRRTNRRRDLVRLDRLSHHATQRREALLDVLGYAGGVVEIEVCG